MTDEPISLAEHRAVAEADARKWTALDLARRLLRRIEAGEICPTRMIVHYMEGDEEQGFSHNYMCAGVTVDTHLSLLVVAQDDTLQRWKG